MSATTPSPTLSAATYAAIKRLSSAINADLLFTQPLRDDIREVLQVLTDVVECYDDHRRIAREMDVSMFGEDGAAKAPTVGDIACSVRDMARDNRSLRLMLYVAHSGMKGYHDDGELQDTSQVPHIDWKRDSLTDIRRKVVERIHTQYKAEQDAARLPSL